MLGDLVEIARQYCDRLVNVGALVSVERSDGLRRRSLQLVEQLDRERSKVVDEVQRVLDLVGDPGSQLT